MALLPFCSWLPKFKCNATFLLRNKSHLWFNILGLSLFYLEGTWFVNIFDIHNYLNTMKSIVLTLSFLLLVSFGFSQSKSVNKFDLPPGFILSKKADFSANYWYKLKNIHLIDVSDKNLPRADLLKSFTDNDFEKMKLSSPHEYEYYLKVKNYVRRLSLRVKLAFTYDELWAIYMFNPALKNELLKH